MQFRKKSALLFLSVVELLFQFACKNLHFPSIRFVQSDIFPPSLIIVRIYVYVFLLVQINLREILFLLTYHIFIFPSI